MIAGQTVTRFAEGLHNMHDEAKTAAITANDVIAWLDRTDLNKDNPVDSAGGCVYTAYENDAEVKHCIAGQFFVDHGVPVQFITENTNADELAQRLGFSDEVGETLFALQHVADEQTKQNRRISTHRTDLIKPAWQVAANNAREAHRALAEQEG